MHNSYFSLTLKKRVEFLILLIANQYSLIPNNSILPSELKLLTEHTLTSCDFSEPDILQIINNQDSNKAHGHDMISILMLKLCGEAICRPLNIIFKTYLNFLQNGRKAMLFQFIKKMISKMLKITVLYHSYLYAVRCLNA